MGNPNKLNLILVLPEEDGTAEGAIEAMKLWMKIDSKVREEEASERNKA